MTEDYRRGYLDALHYASGMALAFERIATTEADRLAGHDLRSEIDIYLHEFKSIHLPLSDDARRAQLLSSAPELLETLKHVLTAIEQGAEINPGLALEYRFVIDRAEGKL